jgi:predicted glycosyltransferase
MSGGTVPPQLKVPVGVELVRLPAIGSCDGEGKTLVSRQPGLDLQTVWARRRSLLSSLLDELQPTVIVVELFPFGRRQFAPEITDFLERAHRLASRPVVVSSVRDILVRGGPAQHARDDEAAERLNRYFDLVVVHADPRFARLEETFRPSIAVLPPVRYTGFVVPAGEPPPRSRSSRADDNQPAEVVVSAGGGMTGGPLMRAAAEAHGRYLGSLGIITRLVTGPFLPAKEMAELKAVAAGCPGLSVERFVPDFRAVLARASVSVSRCGYNTSLDLLRTGVPALVVPYDEGSQTEQADRARRLAALGAVRDLPARDLSAARLGSEVVGLLSSTPVPVALDLSGAGSTAAAVAELVVGRSLRQGFPGGDIEGATRVVVTHQLG